MGELWRSEEMQLVQLFVQMEAAHDTVDELGKTGLLQFRDLNPHVNAYQRNFINEVKRADEMLRRLRNFDKHIESYNKEASQSRTPKIRIEPLNAEDYAKVQAIDELETKFEGLEKQVQEISTHLEALIRNLNQLIEIQQVLNFGEVARAHRPDERDDEAFTIEDSLIKFGSISGVIARNRFPMFEKILFRATRGNLFMKHSELRAKIKDPQSGLLVEKNVFVIFFQGERLEAKIKKICESFSANLYPCPDSTSERNSLRDQVNSRLTEIKIVIERGADQRLQLLTDIASHLSVWTEKVTREKSIYHTMNLFNYDLGRRCLIAEGWCPVKSADSIQLALRDGRKRSGALIPSVVNVVPSTDTPPTYFRTNNLTRGFQSIVDSYGTARYREVNPAVFTIVTFPFEFGIMFGDVGHGTMLLLAALFMIYMERHWEGKKLNEMIAMIYTGRYTILLMSIFSVYIGALYDELFALPMNFGSNWEFVNAPPYNTFRPVSNWTYPFGVDPVWKGATNELTFYNSLKMKTSVTIGVIQMSLGLILHLFNGIYFRAYYDVFFEFIPRFVFLMSTFGYLVFMIFYKWNTNYDTPERSHNAPVLLNEMIYMFLPGNPNTDNPLYPLQASVQPFLVAFVIVSIPMMMLPKPILLLLDHNAQEKGYNSIWALLFRKGMRTMKVESHVDPSSDDLMVLGEETTDIQDSSTSSRKPKASGGGGGHGGHGEEFEFSELMVHQGLETIEFILGCVSHTASYLRLWALSLAHSELATVFWEKIMGTFWGYSTTSYVIGGFASFAAFSCWFAATIFVLLGMESLSAFLHALRLHWVEFQSKFYRGDGYPFTPFTYEKSDDDN